MYVEFRLPEADLAQLAVLYIDQEIQTWANKHKIKYRTKIHKLTYRLCFYHDQDYNYFALTWDPTAAVAKHFKFVNPK